VLRPGDVGKWGRASTQNPSGRGKDKKGVQTETLAFGATNQKVGGKKAEREDPAQETAVLAGRRSPSQDQKGKSGQESARIRDGGRGRASFPWVNGDKDGAGLL